MGRLREVGKGVDGQVAPVGQVRQGKHVLEDRPVEGILEVPLRIEALG